MRETLVADVSMCACVCKLDIGTWKMKVNSMATQGYFCPSIHLSVLLTLSQLWISLPLPSLLSPKFPPPFYSSLCHLSLSPPARYISDLSLPSQTSPTSLYHPISKRPVTLHILDSGYSPLP